MTNDYNERLFPHTPINGDNAGTVISVILMKDCNRNTSFSGALPSLFSSIVPSLFSSCKEASQHICLDIIPKKKHKIKAYQMYV